ncbi:cation diffusion facilitator family transporter [Streptomyces sp. NPDC005148]
MSDQSTHHEPHRHDHGDHRHAEHDHQHGHDHGHDGHGHGPGRWSQFRHRVAHLVKPHNHEAADKVDSVMETSVEGMRTLWISLGILGLTAVMQAVVVVLSGSVALLGDTIHNASDALTALPLGVAFILGRRAATRRFTYGFGRAEDLAGIFIVLTIAASSALAAWTAIDRLLNPREISYLPAVAVAALIGFIGNEWVARYRITTGKRIGSAALVADGLHARTDGFTSLAVLLGAGGAALGWPLADPIVGLLITIAILAVLRGAVREVFRRLMDAVDPALIDTAETALSEVDGVEEVGELRMRWIGHQLRAEVAIVVAGDLSVRDAHQVAVDAEHALLHAVPRLTAALVHADPDTDHDDTDPHSALAHHHAHA